MAISNLPLSYCTNVHPGQSAAEVIDGISTCTAVAAQTFNRPLAAGLWLPRSVVTELLDSRSKLEQIGQVLWQHDLGCYTLNTFPFGNFHSSRVKENVYLPDWSTPDRLRYTLECAQLLAELLPKSAEGSLSTVPLGGRMNPTRAGFADACFNNVLEAAGQLAALYESTGRLIRLAIEPEPMCHLSSIPNDVIPWFAQLRDKAKSADRLDVVEEYVGLCLDVCHQAVEFEDLTHSIDLLESHSIRINKLHITNAVEVQHPLENDAGRQALLQYVEPRYLHQTYAKFSDGSIQTRLDLTVDDVNCSPPDQFLKAESWRVHFHVPVFAETLGPLNTTRKELEQAVSRIAELPYSPHLEVETYTWPVMPGEDDPQSQNLAGRIAGELEAATQIISGGTRG
ncbi:MAG: metabolite traffic protein EboE [Fuerstiella sp.]|nr:metabolite traffic protein EboE [Fuerstiella sp.]